MRFSQGQRARVAVARALLSDPRVLVLDAPTASLDHAADAALMDALRRSGHRAVLLISHRLSKIAAADRVVSVERG
ncbi:ATP-binding cassette domain-containing protein [Microbacterium amylolyticum]|uniref:ABC-type multidrug transport system fused ATPase/permease subunit n=1 Tax=Microbacterium amylolyticum TaxID=936337 RepID=A0ABS4ZED8_9MICO|nr:ATP-binding cassette domain-containing protein [Microbacterium amylolyticum]MBP2435572.1 ABC-type multidrug transport system fused ATPase/permease subunit [Microbacterium amylolyticum]